MTEKRLIIVGANNEVLSKLPVLTADMVHPGWMRLELEPPAPGWEQPTICWQRVPSEAHIVELQDRVTEADVIARLNEAEAGDVP